VRPGVHRPRARRDGLVYAPDMGAPSDLITITLPRSVMPELPAFANALNDRMHDLLERNTEGTLSESERVELESLVQMAQFAQILAMAMQQRSA
jgi:hypothetical protein